MAKKAKAKPKTKGAKTIPKKSVAAKMNVEDLLDVTPIPLRAPKTTPADVDLLPSAGLVEQRGSVAFYDRKKGSPVPASLNPEQRWVLMVGTEPHFFDKKAAGRKALRQAAKGFTPTAIHTNNSTSAKPDSNESDPDLDAVSDSGGNAPTVPSLWVTEGGRFGLLVYYGRSRARMINLLSGGFSVGKLSIEQLHPNSQSVKAAVTHRQSQSGKEILVQPGDYWWPADTHLTPGHYRDVFLESTLSKTAGAMAFINKLVRGATITEEDLLS